ncbi:MAG TPA: zinc ribbon domain-containing protein [Sedimentisphaerales bacterium]|nr:zinc ribbon domain-containing protein [Sedimentisphaerales bacterium]
MTLISCPECKNEISSQAEACPKCGYSLKKRSEKKSSSGCAVSCLVMLILFIILIAFGSFYDSDSGRSSSSSSNTTTSLFDDEGLNRPSRSEPSRSDFKILSLKGVWREYTGLVAIGEIKNEGDIAAGVEIEVIARDKNGILVDSSRFWPNSISNIFPGETCGIDFPITEDRSAETIEAKVISVNIWR